MIQADDDNLITAPQLQERWSVSREWIRRRLNDPESGFPRPIAMHAKSRFRHWRLGDLREYFRKQAAAS